MCTDFVKLGIYSAFFAILMMFYGLPIHIMRDLFMTAKSFISRLGALLRYRKALQDMNRYPDATQEELAREDTCIICREDMRPWDPDAGAVERSRPKKLPCGHILHFGCLKSWLERQQVCPTCRRSVVIDGAAANADARGPQINGQPQAQDQRGADNRPGNDDRPAQGGRGVANMRVWQFGPLRLGIAQGNPQNIAEMAQRLQHQPLDAVNRPPPAPPTGPQPAQAAQATQAAPGGDNITHGTNNITDITTQLQDIAQRVQQEMLALQTSQHELQTLYALTAELARLRQLQQQPQAQGAFSTSQPGQGGPHQPFSPQPPVNLTGPFTQPGSIGLGIPFPPSAAPFASYPPRLTSPTISRYGGASNTTAIPAGSADLPEGVTIPDGWTLLPLERLDGQNSYAPHGTQQSAVSFDIAPTRTVANPSSEVPAPTGTGVSERTFHPGSTPNTDEPLNLRPESPEAAATTANPVQTEDPPTVAAPTPTVPNWGGPAQLFSSSEDVSTDGIRDGGTHEGSGGLTPSGSDSHNDDNEEQRAGTSGGEGISSKGKAKAVTVEDAADDEDDAGNE